ncbi:Ca(2+)-dependent cysteine protease, partial [Borealophlyctis nickersoniae]
MGEDKKTQGKGKVVKKMLSKLMVMIEDETANWPAFGAKNKPQPPETEHNPHNAPYPSRPDSGKFTMQHQPGVGETEEFVLSNCTGTKKALLIGINYSSHESGQLNGCINDVINIKNFLIEKYDFPAENMRILTDSPDREPDRQPTHANILEAMQWLVKDAQPDDSLFFHFSGHGGYLEDDDGDEDDGWDETICPVDYDTEGQIRDDT